MSTEVFKAKSKAELLELAFQSRASIECESGGLCQENRSVNQEGASKASTARKFSVVVNYVLDLSNYALDLSDFAGTSNVLSNSCIASCLL